MGLDRVEPRSWRQRQNRGPDQGRAKGLNNENQVSGQSRTTIMSLYRVEPRAGPEVNHVPGEDRTKGLEQGKPMCLERGEQRAWTG